MIWPDFGFSRLKTLFFCQFIISIADCLAKDFDKEMDLSSCGSAVKSKAETVLWRGSYIIFLFCVMKPAGV